MPDVADLSDTTIELNTAAALSKIRVPLPRSFVTAPCEQCGEPIGTARGRLGYDTCIDCATEIERANRQFAFASSGHEAY